MYTAILSRPVLSLLVVCALQVPQAFAIHTHGSDDKSVEIEKQRELFIEARAALADGKVKRLRKMQASLDSYPLRHYLEYEELRRKFGRERVNKSHVGLLNAFERRSGDRALTRKLTRKLQSRLVRNKQWSVFLGVSKSEVAASMPCATLRARYETGQLKSLDESALELWVKPEKHSSTCAGVLKILEANKTPPLGAIWEKIFTAIEAGKPELIKSQLRHLGKRDRRLVNGWLKARKSPKALLLSGKLDKNTVFNRRAVADLVIQWSRQDVLAAMTHWKSIQHKYSFFADRHYETFRQLGLRSAYRRQPEAYALLNSFEAREDDLELMEWRVRTALFSQNWTEVLRSISELPEIEQQEDHWAYWVARSLEELGETVQADAIYSELATLQSFHGFLAADRVGVPYGINNVPIEASPDLLARMSDNPALIRAREYHHVQLPWEGRREWNTLLKEGTPDEIAAMAVVGGRWGLHDRAIFAAGRAEKKQALGLRFPVLYRSEVANASQQNSIDPAWVYGVMRRESAYIADIRSSAGAVGLMQLMPQTAKFVARLKGDKKWNGDLTAPETNIGLGSHYLRHVMDKFDDHQVLATASYNAGPHRVSKWLEAESLPADVWIDTIPFTETRRYVRAVMAYTAIYEWQLTGKARRLKEKLWPVPAATGT